MSAFVRLARACTAVRGATTAFFRHDLVVCRDGGGLRVALQSRDAGPGSRGAGDGDSRERGMNSVAARRQDLLQQERALICTQLADLLDALPETRGSAQHLAFVEKALGDQGLQALHHVPLDVLQEALDQIEALVTNWSPRGLASLRSKMAVAVADRVQGEPDADADADVDRAAAALDQAADAAGLRDTGPSPHAAAGETQDDAALLAAYASLMTTAAAGDIAPAPSLV